MGCRGGEYWRIWRIFQALLHCDNNDEKLFMKYALGFKSGGEPAARQNFSFRGPANAPMGRNDGGPRAARHKRACQREYPSRRGLVQSEAAGQRAFWKYPLIDLLVGRRYPVTRGADRWSQDTHVHTRERAITHRQYLGSMNERKRDTTSACRQTGT